MPDRTSIEREREREILYIYYIYIYIYIIYIYIYIYIYICYIASAETKRDWLIRGQVALDKCNVCLGQQVNNCCPLRPAPYINKQNGGETRKSINSDFRAFCLKKYTISREDMLLKLKFKYSSKFWLF